MLVAYVNNLTAGVYGQVVDTELYERLDAVQRAESHILVAWIWGLRMPWEYGRNVLDTTRRFLQLRYSLFRTSIRIVDGRTTMGTFGARYLH